MAEGTDEEEATLLWFLPRSLPEAPRPPKNQYDEDPDPPALEPLNTLQEEETPNISEIAKGRGASCQSLYFIHHTFTT